MVSTPHFTQNIKNKEQGFLLLYITSLKTNPSNRARADFNDSNGHRFIVLPILLRRPNRPTFYLSVCDRL